MRIDLYNTVFAASLIAMFTYQFSIFSYASNLLVGGVKNSKIYAGLALLNTTVFAYVQYIQLEVHYIIIVFMVALIMEFKFISKTDFVQVICGASIFILHIFSITIPLIIIFSDIFNISPAMLIKDTIYDHFIVMITAAVLTLAHQVVKKYIDNSSIQRVTVKSNHSIILLCSIVLLVFLQIIHSMTMMTDVFYSEQVMLSLAISITSLLIFYLFFLYAINLIDASLYKRHSDRVIGEQQLITKKKETLLTKIERDELTGVFNRGYIMEELEKLCADNTDSFYVLFVDINALKYTNDTYGHSAGDRMIIRITQSILRTMREQDIVARIGGDEFLVVMPNTIKNDCVNVIERIEHAIELENENEEFLVSASIGSIYVDDKVKEKGVAHILSVADENMRKNKSLFYEKRRGNAE